jgi:prephenate dehydrogenase
VLDAIRAALDAARAALDAPDPIAALLPWLAPGHAARVAWPPRPGPATDEPAGADDLLALGRAGGWITAVAADRRTVTTVRPTGAP